MATAQTSKAGNNRNKQNQRAGARDNESVTGERDENYNLVSLLYHALQAAETAQQYTKDAQRSGDKELVEFFEEARGGYVTFAEKAKRLLAARLDVDEAEDDEDDEDDEDESDED
jgi:hypothetical protein